MLALFASSSDHTLFTAHLQHEKTRVNDQRFRFSASRYSFRNSFSLYFAAWQDSASFVAYFFRSCKMISAESSKENGRAIDKFLREIWDADSLREIAGRD
jgi:hypothetical protein